MGTQAEDIERAKDRSRFSKMIDEMGLCRPEWSVLSSVDDAILSTVMATDGTKKTKGIATEEAERLLQVERH